jgi:hypothetical protein
MLTSVQTIYEFEVRPSLQSQVNLQNRRLKLIHEV